MTKNKKSFTLILDYLKKKKRKNYIQKKETCLALSKIKIEIFYFVLTIISLYRITYHYIIIYHYNRIYQFMERIWSFYGIFRNRKKTWIISNQHCNLIINVKRSLSVF